MKDYKWLIARERGEDIGHVPAAERGPYERLGALLGSGMAPSAGFRQRVLDAIDAAERDARSAPAAVTTAAPAAVGELATADGPTSGWVEALASRRTRLRWIAGGLAAAAAAALVVFSRDRGSSPTDPAVELATDVRPGGTVVRGDPQRGGDRASVGDTLVVRAEATGPVELRVYGGSSERLLATCNDRGGCAVTRDGERRRLVLEVPLDVPGTVRAVVFIGADVPASDGSLGPDLERAAGAKIQTRLGAQKRVL